MAHQPRVLAHTCLACWPCPVTKALPSNYCMSTGLLRNFRLNHPLVSIYLLTVIAMAEWLGVATIQTNTRWCNTSLDTGFFTSCLPATPRTCSTSASSGTALTSGYVGTLEARCCGDPRRGSNGVKDMLSLYLWLSSYLLCIRSHYQFLGLAAGTTFPLNVHLLRLFVLASPAGMVLHCLHIGICLYTIRTYIVCLTTFNMI